MKKINVDENLVRHVSDLARLKISDQEISEYKDNFQKILDYTSMLDEVDVSGVEPLYNPITENTEFFEKELGQSYKKREDKPRKSLGAKEVLKNAPDMKNNEFKIDAVMEE